MIKMAVISSWEMTAKIRTNLHIANFFNGFNILFCSKIFDLVQECAILIIASILRNMKTPSKDTTVYNWSCIEARLPYNKMMLPISSCQESNQIIRDSERYRGPIYTASCYKNSTKSQINLSFIYHWCQWTNWSYSWEFLHQIDFHQFKLGLYSIILLSNYKLAIVMPHNC